MDDGTGRVDHEVGHGALARLLEAIDVVRNAHLVTASLAVPAFMAGDDLLGDDEVADGDSVTVAGALAEGNHGAGKLVARSHRGLNELAVGWIEMEITYRLRQFCLLIPISTNVSKKATSMLRDPEGDISRNLYLAFLDMSVLLNNNNAHASDFKNI